MRLFRPAIVVWSVILRRPAGSARSCVDFFALLAHVPTTRPPADRFLSQREAFPAALFVTAPKETTALRAPYLIRQQRN